MEPSLPYPLLTQSEETMSGAIVFAGTRVPVQVLIDHLVPVDLFEEFLENFPSVDRDLAMRVREALELCNERPLQVSLAMTAEERLELSFQLHDRLVKILGKELGVDREVASRLRKRWRQAGRRPSKCMSDLIG